MAQITLYTSRLTKDARCKMVKESVYEYGMNSLNSPEVIVDMMRSLFLIDQMAEEHLYAIYFNSSFNVTGIVEISHGLVNQTVCQPREVFQKALLLNASAVVIVHNHPSGQCAPSKEDREIFTRLEKAGELMGIQVCDSIIIGRDTYYSEKEQV